LSLQSINSMQDVNLSKKLSFQGL